MGCVDPPGVFTPSGLFEVEPTCGLLRASPSVRLALLLRGPSQHPRTVPGDRSLRLSDDASFPGLSCPTTHAGTADPLRAGVQPCAVPRPRFGYLHRGVHHHPSGSLAAPERPRASPFEAFSSVRSDSLSEVPALLPLRASIRLAPIGACGRDRLQGLAPGSSSFCPSHLAVRRAEASWGSSLQSVLPLCPYERFVDSRPLPHHALGGIDVPSRLRLGVLRSRGIGLPLSGLPALLGFFTLQPSRHHRESKGRAGSWFRLTTRGVYAPRIDLSPLRSDSTQG
jgi:hypothetical protein